jgi:SAM-dependent methyltransferase
MYKSTSALNVALELGIFWLVSDTPRTVPEISQHLNIPLHRCRALLEVLIHLGLLEKHNDQYLSSPLTRTAILDVYSAETWAFMARETQVHYPLLTNLTSNISYAGSLWKKQQVEPPDWFDRINNDLAYAKAFTYGLYEFHLSFAQNFAKNFDLSEITRMMDIGGGSGVMSLELLKCHPHLSAVIIDIANVCLYGKEIAENFYSLVRDRINYETVDFLKDDLPKGFELILQCDAGIFSVDFFNKLRRSLTTDGRLVIITNIDDDSAWLAHPTSGNSFYKSMNRFFHSLALSSVKRGPRTIEDVKSLLLEGGFSEVVHDIWDKGEVIIQAFK